MTKLRLDRRVGGAQRARDHLVRPAVKQAMEDVDLARRQRGLARRRTGSARHAREAGGQTGREDVLAQRHEAYGLRERGGRHVGQEIAADSGVQRLRPIAGLGAAGKNDRGRFGPARSGEHTSELQSLMRLSYAVFCLQKKKPAKLHIYSSLINYQQSYQYI